MEAPDTVMTDGAAFNRPGLSGSFFTRIPVDLETRPVAAVTEVEIVNGCCMMVSADVFRRIGLVDERFFLVHEEADLCLRARAAGFRSGVIGEALVWHKGSASFKRTGRRLQRYYDTRNLLLPPGPPLGRSAERPRRAFMSPTLRALGRSRRKTAGRAE